MPITSKRMEIFEINAQNSGKTVQFSLFSENKFEKKKLPSSKNFKISNMSDAKSNFSLKDLQCELVVIFQDRAE
ncbi:hypothetical protein BpHYR1_044214, partial [Brachionus plicatilis]